mmetsp:Transcript_48253/g.78387  ORF Transcript_48253/g.78387 Transcript_48253/m.78387 type:complete len:80 (-) Transcript_48253:671-910(-)
MCNGCLLDPLVWRFHSLRRRHLQQFSGARTHLQQFRAARVRLQQFRGERATLRGPVRLRVRVPVEGECLRRARALAMRP